MCLSSILLIGVEQSLQIWHSRVLQSICVCKLNFIFLSFVLLVEGEEVSSELILEAFFLFLISNKSIPKQTGMYKTISKNTAKRTVQPMIYGTADMSLPHLCH